jgi:hypothetical protein
MSRDLDVIPGSRHSELPTVRIRKEPREEF